MASQSEERIYPNYTFGINQVFDAAFDSGWTSFPGHYLLYASTGAFQLEVDDVRWLLPPQRAAWVAAGVSLRLSAAGAGTTSSVLFAPGSIPSLAFACRVFAVSTLAREMLLYATRWTIDRDGDGPGADAFFSSLVTVCMELAARPDAFWLPRARTPELREALDQALAQLSDAPTFAELASTLHLSERTLARRFADETGMTWSAFLRRARMIRAMELLADPATNVIDVAYAVGFSSISAFNHAFRTFTGETPTSYRERI